MKRCGSLFFVLSGACRRSNQRFSIAEDVVSAFPSADKLKPN